MYRGLCFQERELLAGKGLPKMVKGLVSPSVECGLDCEDTEPAAECELDFCSVCLRDR